MLDTHVPDTHRRGHHQETFQPRVLPSQIQKSSTAWSLLWQTILLLSPSLSPHTITTLEILLYQNPLVCIPSMDRLPLSRTWGGGGPLRGGGPPPERQGSAHPPWVLLQGFQLIDQFSRERKVQLLGNYTACWCKKVNGSWTNSGG